MMRKSCKHLCWLVVLLVDALGQQASWAQEMVVDFTGGPPTGVYSFASKTPRSLADLVTTPVNGDPVNIVGHLFLPAGDARVPAVVFMHGSGGIYSAMLDYWPKLLNEQGIAMLAVNSFGPRGIKSTAKNQSLVPWAADVADAFAALRLLATHPRIDAKRIASMGASRGGATSWRTAVERIISAQQLPDNLRFAAHIQLYSGGCLGSSRLVVKSGVFAKEPMLWVHGEEDNYVPLSACRDYAQRIAATGTPVEFVVIPSAMHKFDADDLRRRHLRDVQRNVASCPLELDIDSLLHHDHTTGRSLTGDEFRRARQACSTTGADIEGNREARDRAGQAIVVFLRRIFAP